MAVVEGDGLDDEGMSSVLALFLDAICIVEARNNAASTNVDTKLGDFFWMREDEGEESVYVEYHSCPLPWELVNILMLHLTKLFSTLALSEMSC